MSSKTPLLWSRRRLVQASAAVGGLGLSGIGWRPRIARANPTTVSGSDLKFIFVVNYGGWDPTRVFAPEFDNPFVDMESDAEAASIGDLTFVDHPSRPAVRSFFEDWSDRCLLINGILVSSIAHENCLRIQMTGSTAQDRSDWGAILGGDQASAFALPQVVIGGPSYPGEFGAYVTRTGTGGQLESLLSGDIFDWSDVKVTGPDRNAEDVMDAFMLRRAAAVADQAKGGSDSSLKAAWEVALQRAQYLKGLERDVDWSGATSFAGQAELAADLLSLDVARVATLSFSHLGWDSHASNDYYQSANFEELFSQLGDLMTMLRTRPGTVTESLADETVVVVLSEMGRTPQLNSLDGKDHWPYTSALVCGPGVTGGRVIGDLDDSYYGKTIDPATGELETDATNLSSDVFGATLLTLADIDSEEFASGITPITGVLS